jgi:hypothetical protein
MAYGDSLGIHANPTWKCHGACLGGMWAPCGHVSRCLFVPINKISPIYTFIDMPNHASSFLLDYLFHVTEIALFCIEIGERCDW